MKTPSRIFRLLTLITVLATLLALLPLNPARVATLTVMNTADSGPGSLRATIQGATSGDTIDFDASLAGTTIRFGAPHYPG